jgi:hypothetical protein
MFCELNHGTESDEAIGLRRHEFLADASMAERQHDVMHASPAFHTASSHYICIEHVRTHAHA